MRFLKYFLLWCGLLVQVANANAQSGRKISTSIVASTQPQVIHKQSIIPESLVVIEGNDTLTTKDYQFDLLRNTISFNPTFAGKLVKLSYAVFSWNWETDLFVFDTSLIQTSAEEPITFRAEKTGSRFLNNTASLQKQGSITRGLVVGNGQNSSVNSDLQLQLSGKLTPNINIRGNISDRNIPIQPEGNTQNLQEFDQVFVELWNDRFKLQAGDFEERSKYGYFLKYQKRARGLSFHANDKNGRVQTQITGGISRGKFNRMVIQGIEGNQGPYRLIGLENEDFIVVVAGTERVFINGELLERGLDRDYVIDYNNAEITFSANRLITKDYRIIVEFQYASREYSRALLIEETQLTSKNERLQFYTQYYNEFDNKNQPLQYELSTQTRNLLNNAGDPISGEVLVPGFKLSDFNENAIQYAFIDSLGFDSVFVYSTNPDSAKYLVNFTEVGQGNGDYVLDNPLANGRVFRWVKPDSVGGNSIKQGNYKAVIAITPPSSQRLFVNGINFKHNNWIVNGELALSGQDLNTLSDKGDGDNVGNAFKISAQKKIQLNKTQRLSLFAETEQQNKTFTAVERFRSVEYERDWNIGLNNAYSELTSYTGGAIWEKDSLGSAKLSYNKLLVDSVINGTKSDLQWQLKQHRFESDFKGAYLSNSVDNLVFFRHLGKHTYKLKKWELSYADEREEHKRKLTDSLSSNSYQFYWWRANSGYNFTDQNKLKIFYGERLDRYANGLSLKRGALAKEAGLTLQASQIKNHSIGLTSQYRTLSIIDSSLINIEPEATLLWQLNVSGNIAKGFVNHQLFFESGSGLERQLIFQYIEVPVGQGIYAYTDFNGNGVKELDEFYESPFDYEANYIKVYLPGNDYVKASSARLNYSIALLPSSLLKKETFWQKTLGKLSTQHVFNYYNKLSNEDAVYFLLSNSVQALLTRENRQTHRIMLNQYNPKFSFLYQYQEINNRQFLSGGFQTRFQKENSFSLNKRFGRYINTTSTINFGNEALSSDLLVLQNYGFSSTSYSEKVNAQLNTRLSVEGVLRYITKVPNLETKVKVDLTDVQLIGRYAHEKKGTLEASVGLVNTSELPANLNPNFTVVLYEGFVEGTNITWGLKGTQQVANNLQLTLNYQGRDSKSVKAIHVGTVQLRAYF